jgi:hypothetical protein
VKLGDAGEPDGKAKPDALWIHVHENDIQRVEISLREGPPFDFENVIVLEDEPDADGGAGPSR